MYCDNCKERPANVHITKIINNQKTEKHLCDACAQQSGELVFSSDAKAAVQDMVKGMFSYGLAGGARRADTACPSCGMTYDDFSRGGKIGCGDCYNTYGERIEPLLKRIHGGIAHTGKVPKRGGGALALRRRLLQLRQQLEGHVGREEYEAAAQTRDAIRALEKELGS